MGGIPIARASSAEGRWAYTLYARRGDEPFVHALDTVKREAFCIDLPLAVTYDRQFSLRLTLGSPRQLTVWLGTGRKAASIDTRTWKVQGSS